MKNNFGEISKKPVIYCLCGAIMIPIFTGWMCPNLECPDYMLEENEHLPERQENGDNYKIQTVSFSGTAASGATGAYGPVDFIKWPKEGGDLNE